MVSSKRNVIEYMSSVKLRGLVARDAHGPIYLYDYDSKLYRFENMWYGSRIFYLGNEETLPEVKWENEPMEVEISISL